MRRRPGTKALISTDNGLRLRPADSDHITLDDRIDGHWSHHGDRWTLDLDCADHDGRDCPRMPYVKIPDGAKVTVTARNAGVDMVDAAAALDVTTVNGSVDITVPRDAPAYRVTMSTDNGRTTTDVHAQDVDRNRLMTLTTVNGDLTARRD